METEIWTAADIAQYLGVDEKEARKITKKSSFPLQIRLRGKWISSEVKAWKDLMETQPVIVEQSFVMPDDPAVELHKTCVQVCNIKSDYHVPCVYFLFDGVLLQYVGKTKSLQNRIQKHTKAGKIAFDRVAWIEEFSEYARTMKEVFYIDLLNPACNEVRPTKGYVKKVMRDLGSSHVSHT